MTMSFSINMQKIIDENGFDNIIKINPMQPILKLFT